MTAELLDKKALGVMLSMGGDEARELCHRHGVEPINVGLGKVARLRWSRTEVMRMLDTMRADKPRRRPRIHRTVVGKTVAQLIAELACPLQ